MGWSEGSLSDKQREKVARVSAERAAAPFQGKQVGKDARKPRAQPERAFQASVIEFLQLNGFELVFHDEDSRRNTPGLPDIIAVRPVSGRYKLCFLVLELKIHPNKPTAAQLRWLEAFGSVEGCTALLLYPEDWELLEEAVNA